MPYKGMKTVTLPAGKDILHCEVPGCIVNIYTGLHDSKGREVTSIEVRCDDYSGESQWRINGNRNKYFRTRVIQLKGE